MGNCENCYGKRWLNTGKKTRGGIRIWKCYRCGAEQNGDISYERQAPSILYIDIEVSLSKMYNFGLKVPDKYISPSMLIQEYFIICWAASWVGEAEIRGGCVTQAEAKRGNDRRILTPLKKLMDKADIIAGHNIDRFDIPALNTRFFLNHIEFPYYNRTLDTLKVARKMKFESNKLDYLSQVLGHDGKDKMRLDDWLAISSSGDPVALAKMYKYNRGDVRNGKATLMDLLPFALKNKPKNYGTITIAREPKDTWF